MFRLTRFSLIFPKVFDTHCHLGVRTSIEDKDLLPVFDRAVKTNSVKGMCIVGIDLETSIVAKKTVEKLIEHNNKNGKAEERAE